MKLEVSEITVFLGTRATHHRDFPKFLEDCCISAERVLLKGTRQEFQFSALKPEGTDFSKKSLGSHSLNSVLARRFLPLNSLRKLGDPKAFEAVAAANGRNPIWIVVLSHKLSGSDSDGSLTGLCWWITPQAMAFRTRSPYKQASYFILNNP